VATTPELQQYVVQKLYAALKKDITQEALTLAGAWCIGEFGEQLLKGGNYEDPELVQEVKESEVLDLFASILNSSYATQSVTEYIVTALMKLSTRFTEPGQVDKIRRLLLSQNRSLDVEVQQRAVEYGNLFSVDSVRRGVLEKMPPPQIKEESRVLGEKAKPKRAANAKGKPSVKKNTEEDLLFDLMGDGGAEPVVNVSATVAGRQNNADLLADILGGTSISGAGTQGSQQPPRTGSAVDDIMGLFGNGPSAPPAQKASGGSADLFSSMSPAPPASTPQPSATAHPCYNKNGLNVTMAVQRNAEGVAHVTARFRNDNFAGGAFSGVNVQAAVPKTQKLALQPISKPELDEGEEATQAMRVSGVKGVSLLFHFARSMGMLVARLIADVWCSR
jgi:AP-1 complex subunit gamma-1